jgi:hypothetical protein
MDSAFPSDKFIAEWTGNVLIEEAGDYTFASSSDDGFYPIRTRG